MISGRIRDLEPVIPITLIGPDGRRMNVEAVIDTGFTGYMTIPFALIFELNLNFKGKGYAVLGDGNLCDFDVYTAQIDWDDEIRTVDVDDSGCEILIGMSLLMNHDLRMKIRRNGKVTITRLP